MGTITSLRTPNFLAAGAMAAQCSSPVVRMICTAKAACRGSRRNCAKVTSVDRCGSKAASTMLKLACKSGRDFISGVGFSKTRWMAGASAFVAKTFRTFNYAI